MNPVGPLAGKTIVVTRPQAQAAPLAEAIAAAGGTPLVFPLLEISPAADPRPLAAAAERLADYALAVFISPNAVDYALPDLLAHGPWPAALTPAAVGQGTVKALAAHGIAGCVAPTERFDSEALLELPALAARQVAGKRVAIFRGDGGRELLADTLRQRGATVDCIPCYRRRALARRLARRPAPCADRVEQRGLALSGRLARRRRPRPVAEHPGFRPSCPHRGKRPGIGFKQHYPHRRCGRRPSRRLTCL
jgi:uroporphyrinogen-III synthase